MSIAQDIIDGLVCADCNISFEEENGYSCLCNECWIEKHGKKKWDAPAFVDKEGFQLATYKLAFPHRKGT